MVFERLVPITNLSYVMRNLRHFAAYNIEVQACRAQEMNDTFSKCSTKSMRTYRTLPMKTADNIPPNTFKMSISGENNSLTMVTLQWDEPPQPNGLIITYQIEYKRVDIQNVSRESARKRSIFVQSPDRFSFTPSLLALKVAEINRPMLRLLSSHRQTVISLLDEVPVRVKGLPVAVQTDGGLHHQTGLHESR